GQVTHMNGSWISIMLMVFGIIMIFGNFLFGGLLHKNLIKTVLIFPLLYVMIYLFIYYLSSSVLPMVVVVLIWGAVHSGGLIISQAWLTTETKEAPEFGNSLFVSFSNLGITIGASIGGWFISHLGIHQLIWSGIMFTLLAFLTIIIKMSILHKSQERFQISNI
ncbi:MFS transporter, partial [Paenibacillus terrae]